MEGFGGAIGASEGFAGGEAEATTQNNYDYSSEVEYDEALDWSDTDIESDDYSEDVPEEKQQEETEVNEYALKFLEGVELEAEDIEQIEYYTEMAKEIGLDPQQFNMVAGMVVMMQNEDAIQRMQESMQEEQLQLRNLKKDLSTQEKQVWQTTMRDLTTRFGRETAKKIGLDADVYRAFIALKKQGTGIDIKKTQRASMSFENAVEARAKELQKNLGAGEKKLAEIREKWAKDFPEYGFKK